MARPAFDDPIRATFDPSAEANAGYQDEAMAGQAEAEGLANMPDLNAKNRGMGMAYAEAAEAEQRARVAEADRVYAENLHAHKLDTDPLYRAKWEREQNSANLNALIKQAEQTVTVKRPNLDYGPNLAFTGTMLGTEGQPGLLQQQVQARGQYDEAQRLAAEEHAAGQTRIAQQLEDDNRRLYGYDVVENVVGDAGEPLFNEDGTPMQYVVGRQPGLLEVRQAQERAAMERSKKAEALVATKAQEMQGELGAEGWWKKRTPAQKFGVGLALVLAGIGGGQAVQTMFQAIDDYNTEEKAKFGALRESADESKSLWREIRAQTQSDNEADLLTSNSLLKAAIAHNDAKLAAAGVQVLSAEQQVQRTQMLAEIAENERQLRIMHLTTEAAGPTRTVRVSANSPIRQHVLKKLMDLAAAGDPKATEQVLSILSAREGQRAQLEGKEIEARGKIGEKRAEKEAEFENEIKKSTQAWGAVEVMIDDFLAANPDDIHGKGWWWTGDRSQRISTDQFRTLLPELVISAVTGANSSPDQREAAQRLVEGDWNDVTDEDFRDRLRALKNAAAAQRKYRQRPIGSPKAGIERTDQLSGGNFAPE